MRQWLLFAREQLPEEVRGSLVGRTYSFKHQHWLLHLAYQQLKSRGLKKESRAQLAHPMGYSAVRQRLVRTNKLQAREHTPQFPSSHGYGRYGLGFLVPGPGLPLARRVLWGDAPRLLVPFFLQPDSVWGWVEDFQSPHLHLSVLASGPSQQTDLIGGHSKISWVSFEEIEGLSSARPGLEPVAAATSKTESCKKHGKLQK